VSEVLLDEAGKKRQAPKKLRTWLKRLGLAGFLFFLIKGLLWLFFGGAILKLIAC
jgi:hypothetical protein